MSYNKLMMNFEQTYAKLNAAQREAVDQIYGPVFVLAGPGTGKTQLLSARAANILNLTDVGPENILCLTYTESGATAMKNRMADIIGIDAYKINVMTFHSFALDVASTFSEYFLDTLGYQPIDQLSSYLIIEELLPKLNKGNKLKYRTFQNEGRVKELLEKIAYLKNSGLSPDAILSLAQKMKSDLSDLSFILDLWPDVMRFKKGGLELFINEMATEMLKIKPDPESTIVPIKNLILAELGTALSLAEESNSTKPLTAWKDSYIEKDAKGNFIFKDYRCIKNLEDVTEIYKFYQDALNKDLKLEFSDMILNLNTALNKYPDLSLNLAEKYQFIMVDEFQDTNLAQLNIVKSIAEASEYPNIMAVGDDDQAIYSFQGAQVSNIKQFINMFKDTKLIMLQENYRSGESILTAAETVSGLIESRPSGNKPKKLIYKANLSQPDSVDLTLSQSAEAEISNLVDSIKLEVENGRNPKDIAVLATKHDHLEKTSYRLINAGIPVYYEKSNNLLESLLIEDLLNLSKLVLSLSKGDLSASKELTSSVINSNYWGFNQDAIWKLSLAAHKDKKYWLDLISEGFLGQKGVDFYKFIIMASSQCNNLSLEQMLDLLVGVSVSNSDSSKEPDDEQIIISPFKNYYFSESKLKLEPAAYANFLAELSSLREHLRAFWPDRGGAKLKDLVKYIDIAIKHGGISLKTNGLHINEVGVNLMSAHGSKGLEFESVYIVHANDDVWGTSARGKNDTLKFTSNLLSHSNGVDDKTRLFYVALTRAKIKLNVGFYKFDLKGSEKLPSEYVLALKNIKDDNVKFNDKSELKFSLDDAVDNYTDSLFGLNSEGADNSLLGSVLRPVLDGFRLSATSFNNWLDDDSDGKIDFIQNNLLRFPRARNESAIQGSAIHKSLEMAQIKLNKTNLMPDLAEMQKNYQTEIEQSELETQSKSKLIENGNYSLEKFYQKLSLILEKGSKPEVSINTSFERAAISGKLDLLKFNHDTKIVTVIDFKTGQPNSKKSKYYRNQLYFYRLLLDLRPDLMRFNSSQYKLKYGQLVYISPREDDLITETVDYDNPKKEIEYLKFKDLVLSVWDQIQALGE
jgi:DNA helicase-2/ATP-dependent DNA helicase PcrA